MAPSQRNDTDMLSHSKGGVSTAPSGSCISTSDRALAYENAEAAPGFRSVDGDE